MQRLALTLVIVGCLGIAACSHRLSSGAGDLETSDRLPMIVYLIAPPSGATVSLDTAHARDRVLDDVFGRGGYTQAPAGADRPVLRRTLSSIRGFSMTLTPEEVSQVEGHALVDRVEPDRVSQPQQ